MSEMVKEAEGKENFTQPEHPAFPVNSVLDKMKTTMSVLFRCLVLVSLLFRVFTTDAMALPIAMGETDIPHATTIQATSANTPCDQAALHAGSAPSDKSCCDHDQHAKCLDCCHGALMMSSRAVLTAMPRPPFLSAVDVAYVGIDLAQLTKPPIF